MKSKPTWSNTSGCSTTPAFFWRRVLLLKESSMGLTLLVILFVLFLGSLPTSNHSRNWGHGFSGNLGLLLVIALLPVTAGYIPRGF